MSLLSKALKLGALLTLLVAVFVGIFSSGIARQLGFFSWLAQHHPAGEHLLPATTPVDYKWGYTPQQLARADLSGQTALVTGANSGTGYWTSLALVRAGASVTLGCRSTNNCEEAVRMIRANTSNGQVSTLIFDTSQLSTVRRAADEFKATTSKLDMLFLNAGIVKGIGTSPTGGLPLSADGIEMVFATNYLGHHLLFQLVAHLLERSPRARVVLTSSGSSYQSYSYGVATDLETLNGAPISDHPYAQSKLAQVLWAQELTRRVGPNATIYANSYHPGMAATNIFGKTEFPPIVKYFLLNFVSKLMWTAEEGALTGIYLGVEVGTPGHEHRGKYFHPVVYEKTPPDHAFDLELQKSLWRFSDELVAKYLI